MLSSAYEVLRKIEEGIDHKVLVSARADSGGLVVRSVIRCSKDGRDYSLSHNFSVEEMRCCVDDSGMVDDFIHRANSNFRAVYVRAIEG